MTPVEKLVQQINRALAEKPDRVTLERLAREYHELCQATNRRLEQCEAMLAAGDHYQFIQLAETPPPVLDLVAGLSFEASDEWHKLCRASNLPVPDPFSERTLKRINELYDRGITAEHPLYRDYRGAMVERNDERALGILRTIIKLNKNKADESAKSEFQRLEQKVRDQKIAALDKLLQKRDVPAVLAALTGLEAVFPQATLTGPVIEQARAVRREQDRQQATRRCEELITGLAPLKQANNWQKTLESTQEIEALGNQHGVELGPELAKQFTTARTWANGIKAQADQEQRYREALQQFRTLVVTPPARARGPVRPALKAELAALTSKRAELEIFGRPLAGELLALAGQREKQIRRQIMQAERQQAWLLAGGVVLILALLAGGFFWWSYEHRISTQLAELQLLIESNKVSDAEQRLTELSQVAEVKAPHPRVREMMTHLSTFIGQAKDKREEVAGKINSLEPYFTGALTNAPTTEIASKLQEAQTAYGTVAGEYTNELARLLENYQQLLKMRQTVEAKLIDVFDRQRRQQLETLLTETESELTQTLESTNRWQVMQVQLQSISQNLTNATPKVRPTDGELQNRLTTLKAKIEPLLVELRNLETASRDSQRARTLENYLAALGQFRSVHFSELPELRAAGKVLAASNSFVDVVATLLLPDDPEGWAAFKANPNADFYPSGEIQAAEANILLGLRDNENLRNIFRYERPATVSSKPEIPLGFFYARGAAQLGSQVGTKLRFTSTCLVPDAGVVQATFTKTNFQWEAKETAVNELPGQLSPESRVFATLALQDLVDSQSSKVRKSLLGVLDTLRAAQGINPVFRAYIQHQLFELMDVRWPAWGGSWVPAIKEHRKALKDMDVGELQSADWMLPTRADQWKGKLANFYQTAAPVSYVKLARYNRALVQGAAAAGFGYAGFIDGAGKAVLLDDAIKGTEFWGLTKETAKLELVLRKGVLQTEPEFVQPALSFTPLFYMKSNRQTIRITALRTAGILEAELKPEDTLPPLFK